MWQGLVIRKKRDHKNDTYKWIITDDRRVEVMNLVKEVCLHMIGENDWVDSERAEYKAKWTELIKGYEDNAKYSVDEIFENIVELREMVFLS